jgi:hypothetical protein
MWAPKGCVFWLFPDYESSVAKGTGAVSPAVQYHSRERAVATDYAPVIGTPVPCAADQRPSFVNSRFMLGVAQR